MVTAVSFKFFQLLLLLPCISLEKLSLVSLTSQSLLQAISAFSAVINRLGEFDDLLDRGKSKSLFDSLEGIDIM